MTFRGDTIAAIATAPGRGGVAIVRVSGPEALGVGEALTGRTLEPGEGRGVWVGKIWSGEIWSGRNGERGEILTQRHGGTEAQGGSGFGGETASVRQQDGGGLEKTASVRQQEETASVRQQEETASVRQQEGGRQVIDECVVLAFRGPKSYTGEDVVEIQCHGGMVTPRRVLEACFAAGARLAERGEFTARAFYNGRMSLDAAEGVIELVDAKTERAADAALARLGGERGKRHRALYDEALEISSTIEYTLDVDEGELPEGHVERIKEKVKSLKCGVEQAIAKLREGKILREGALVVLAGAPNAGKSSLMNALLGENRAIVSEVPGTTRDSIEEWLDVGGWPVRLTDTAGLRGTEDVVEKEGVARANELIGKADLVVALDCEIDGALRVHAKCDLDGERGEGGSGEILTQRHGGTEAQRVLGCGEKTASVQQQDLGVCGLRVSAKTGEGVEELRKAIARRLEERVGGLEGGEDSKRTTARWGRVGEDSKRTTAREDSKRTTASWGRVGEDSKRTTASWSGDYDGGEREASVLREALGALRLEEDLVLLANGVRACADALGRLVGSVYSEDLLDAIFSRFCVGK